MQNSQRRWMPPVGTQVRLASPAKNNPTVTAQATGGARSVMQVGTKDVPSRAKWNESNTRWSFFRAAERAAGLAE